MINFEWESFPYLWSRAVGVVVYQGYRAFGFMHGLVILLVLLLVWSGFLAEGREAYLCEVALLATVVADDSVLLHIALGSFVHVAAAACASASRLGHGRIRSVVASSLLSASCVRYGCDRGRPGCLCQCVLSLQLASVLGNHLIYGGHVLPF